MLPIVLLFLSSCSTLVAGHFLLNYPVSLGFSDDKEGEGPCGGFPVDFAGNVTNVTAANFPISLRSTHPQADWLFRVTLSKADPFNWTNLLPVVNEKGLGYFCLENLKTPAEFAGKQGVVQVIQNAADGMLYQCAAVNFLAGSSSLGGPACSNATDLTATITNQNALGNSGSSTSTPTASTTAASATPTSLATGGPVPTILSGCLAVFALLVAFAAR